MLSYACVMHDLPPLLLLQDPDDDDIDDETDTMLPPGEVRTGADVEAGEEVRDEGLKPADIDAYWLQRNIAKAYGNLDENEAVMKSEEVFNALQVGFMSCHFCEVCIAAFVTGIAQVVRHGRHFALCSNVCLLSYKGI